MNQRASVDTVCVLGGSDFCRRVQSVVTSRSIPVSVVVGGMNDALGLILSNRPDALLVELGVQHAERANAQVRRLLEQAQERSKNDIYVIIALTASERLLFGGELLFGSPDELTPSGLIDACIAAPPHSMPSVPTLPEQIEQVLRSFLAERARRAKNLSPLPKLNDPGWAQSMVDPVSRELWMTWLPRYASYTNENPIIIGPTGTGKTNLAFALHKLSGRPGQFVSITPRDFSSSELVQAELFGAVAGAYTGAVDKWGLVKSAERGSLFIDELQSIDKDLQGKLITFIENKGYRRVGSSERVDADVRFVFASNRALHEMMQVDVLRHDFAYRLERVQLELKALAERPLDICGALSYALAKIRRQRPQTLPIFGFTSAAYRMLFSYDWPGNLRQLENAVAQLCELADMDDDRLIREQHVLKLFENRLTGAAQSAAQVVAQSALQLSARALVDPEMSLRRGVEGLSTLIQQTALEAAGGDVERAAALIDDSPEHLRLSVAAAQARNAAARIEK